MADISSPSQSYALGDVRRRPSAVPVEKKDDIIHVERTMSGDSRDNDKDHADFNRIDGELAKYVEGSAIEITPEENKRLKRMIDKRVLAVMVFTYFLQALDKGTLSFASIMGIRTDANLVGQQVCSPGNALYGSN